MQYTEPEVLERLGWTKAQLDAAVACEGFPRPFGSRMRMNAHKIVSITPVYFASHVDEWAAARRTVAP
jgi:hypothetical protein